MYWDAAGADDLMSTPSIDFNSETRLRESPLQRLLPPTYQRLQRKRRKRLVHRHPIPRHQQRLASPPDLHLLHRPRRRHQPLQTQRRQTRPPGRQVPRRRLSLLPQQLRMQSRRVRKAKPLRPARIARPRSRQESHRVRASLPSKRHYNGHSTHRGLRRSSQQTSPTGNRLRLRQRPPQFPTRRRDAPSQRPRVEPLGHELRNQQRLRRRSQPTLRKRRSTETRPRTF